MKQMNCSDLRYHKDFKGLALNTSYDGQNSPSTPITVHPQPGTSNPITNTDQIDTATPPSPIHDLAIVALQFALRQFLSHLGA